MPKPPTGFVALLLVFVPPALAANAPHSSPNIVTLQESAVTPQAPAKVRSARELIGQEVKNSRGESLGKLRDFVIDTESGRIVYTVVSSGGVLGMGESVRAVPFSALHAAGEGPENQGVKMDPAAWDQSPALPEKQLALSLRRSAPLGGDQGFANRPGADGWLLASTLPGKNLLTSGEKLGEVEDVIVDLPRQLAAILLLGNPGSALVRTDERFVVPFAQLQPPTDERPAWSTHLVRTDLARAATMPRDQVLASASEIYRWNNHAPGTNDPTPDENRSRTPTPPAGSLERWATVSGDRSQDPAGTTPTAASETLAPVNPNPPVSAVLDALRNDPALADSASSIEVLAERGTVVLRGSVPNEALKQEATACAQSAAAGYPVDNQLSLRGKIIAPKS